MPKFEAQSINNIFESRKKYITEIGRQLEKEEKMEIPINGEKLGIDYRIISLESAENRNADLVVLLSGFGSGWEGIAELGFSLACEGRKVIMLSLPGCGNSDNPSEKYYQADNFDNEAQVINKLIDRLGINAKVHLIGHSMASEIAATFAQKYSEKTSSLVLLNPAGANEKENIAMLGSRFAASGVSEIKEATSFAISSAFSGEKDYEKEIKKYIPKTKSSFAIDRIAQRVSEARRLSDGHLLEKIKSIDCPITYISGQLDIVYPPGSENDETSQLARIIESVSDAARIEKSVMKGLHHNTTIAPDEITAANIEHYLEVAEKKNDFAAAEMKQEFAN